MDLDQISHGNSVLLCSFNAEHLHIVRSTFHQENLQIGHYI